MATYSQLWQVLAKLYGHKEPVGKGPMRARLQKLQEAGIPEGANVGKGKRVDYSMTQIFQIVFCLELVTLGLTPSLAYEMTLRGWPEVFEAIQRIKKYGDRLKDIKQTNELFCITSNPLEDSNSLTCFLTHQEWIFEELSEKDWRRASILNISRLVEMTEVAASEIIGERL